MGLTFSFLPFSGGANLTRGSSAANSINLDDDDDDNEEERKKFDSDSFEAWKRRNVPQVIAPHPPPHPQPPMVSSGAVSNRVDPNTRIQIRSLISNLIKSKSMKDAGTIKESEGGFIPPNNDADVVAESDSEETVELLSTLPVSRPSPISQRTGSDLAYRHIAPAPPRQFAEHISQSSGSPVERGGKGKGGSGGSGGGREDVDAAMLVEEEDGDDVLLKLALVLSLQENILHASPAPYFFLPLFYFSPPFYSFFLSHVVAKQKRSTCKA